jgi:hypothetical protein
MMQQSTAPDILKAAREMRTGVADNNIDPTICGDYAVNQRSHLNGIANVGNESLRSLDLRQRVVKLGLLPSSKGKFAALLGEALGNRKTYAACAAGHQRDFIFQTKFHDFRFQPKT